MRYDDDGDGGSAGSCSRDLKAALRDRFSPSLTPPTVAATLSRFVCLLHGPWTASFSAQAGRLNVVLIK